MGKDSDSIIDVIKDTAISGRDALNMQEMTRSIPGQGGNPLETMLFGDSDKKEVEPNTPQVDQPKPDENNLLQDGIQGVGNVVGGGLGMLASAAGAIPVVGDVAEVGLEITKGVVQAGAAAASLDMDQAKEELAVGVARTVAAVAPVSIGTVALKSGAEDVVRAGFEMKNAGVRQAANDANYKQDISPPSPTPNISQGQAAKGVG